MKHKISFIVTILLAVVMGNTEISAQAARPISLKEAIDLSIKNSKQLKTGAAKIEEATASLREAVERRLPEASITGSYLRLNSPNVNLQTKQSGTGTGTTGEAQKNPSSLLYGMANVSLPLYAGGKIRYGIESSKYLAEAARLDAENDREAVVLNTIDAYDNLFKSKAAVDVVKENLEGARQRVKDFANLERNGLLARNDYLKAELQASNVELSLLDAENNWRLANVNMNLMLGLPDSTVLAANELDLQSAVQLKTLEEYVQLSLQNRKDIAALGLRKKAANTGVHAARADALPSVALTGGYVAADVPNLFTVTNAVNLGLGVKYNLSSFWKSSSIDKAKAREKQIEANEEMLQDAVRLQVNRAYQNYLLSNKKIEVYNKAVVQSEENYKIVRNKFNNALATTTDLIDADVARLQARLNAAVATADASVAYSKLLQTTGQLTNQTNQ